MDQRLNDKIKRRYDRVSRIYDQMDRMVKSGWRQELLAQVSGHVLDLLNPLTVRLWGANINRDTLLNIKTVGLNIETNENKMATIVRKVVLSSSKA